MYHSSRSLQCMYCMYILRFCPFAVLFAFREIYHHKVEIGSGSSFSPGLVSTLSALVTPCCFSTSNYVQEALVWQCMWLYLILVHFGCYDSYRCTLVFAKTRPFRFQNQSILPNDYGRSIPQRNFVVQMIN